MSKNQIVNIAIGFAACAHKDQKRKYTNEPYIVHPKAVMELVSKYVMPWQVACAAVLHDTVEDTSVTFKDIFQMFGQDVVDLVMQVTDVSKPEDGNREERKAIDRAWLAKSKPYGASIKLADLIDNTSTIVRHDPGFAKIYLAEKELLLEVLKHGNAGLHALAVKTLAEAKAQLGL